MYNTDLPTRAELPSTGKLLRSTLMAVVIAVALLISVVLPAEYAIDPTGAGRLLGLTEMGEIKTQLAEEAELDQASAQQASEPAAPQEAVSDSQPSTATATAAPTSDVETEQVAASLPEDQEMVQTEANVALADAPAAEETPSQATEETAAWGDEVTFTLTPGEGTEYKLTMEEGAVATFAWASDGGPLNFDTHGDGNGNSISYEKGRGVPEDEGELEAAFTGNHGWFFRNRNDNDVTVVLRVGGDYGELKGML
ncbi:hypothetical protein [Vreelandella neptunia]|uniref:Transmembrane anchor protein n=1 Tax=Vreelandella neptunia TaxID=115551 RepID=A0ABZ0YKH3_9GAMM|nr:hypothetical protein [Halomonas neptunia]MDN3560462.1 hypothetical protein [Halomonas neptunia]TDV87530.1 hypothetical protein BDK62_1352 [Halomonas alkaliantarctica]WQH12616.1 hypothetical protein SR894_21130 [Halomonas neptunia]